MVYHHAVRRVYHPQLVAVYHQAAGGCTLMRDEIQGRLADLDDMHRTSCGDDMPSLREPPKLGKLASGNPYCGLDKQKRTFGRQKFSFCWWRRGESLSPAGSVRLGSDRPPDGHSLPTRSIPSQIKNTDRQRRSVFFGGGEGNRTPVRKSIHTTFSERRYVLISRRTRHISGKCACSFINS